MIKLYRSCNTLPIARFFRVFDTDDLRNLIVDFDAENPEGKLTNSEIIEYQLIFDDIYYDYCDLSQNHKLKSNLKKRILITQWSFLYTMINSLLNLYEEHKKDSILLLINEIEDVKYQIDFKKPIDPQVKELVRKMKGLKTKIKIFKIKIAESMKREKKSVKMDLDRDALYLERNLELKRSIDPETTSISKWVRMIQMSKQKAKDGKSNSSWNRKSRRSG